MGIHEKNVEREPVCMHLLGKSTPDRVCPSSTESPANLTFLDLVLWDIRSQLRDFTDKITAAYKSRFCYTRKVLKLKGN
jgi:hypothetical protein